MAKNITIDLVNNKITADALVLYDAVTLVVITGVSGTFSADAERTPKLTVAWHRFPLLEDNTNWKINEDGSNATIEFVLNSFELKDSFVHIPAKGYRQFEFNVTIPKNNSAVASARLNVKNNTLEGIPFSQQDRDKLDSIDLSLYYTRVEVDDLLKDIEPGGGGETYTFLEPLSVDKDNVVSIDLTAYAKLTDLPNVPTLVSAFTNDAGYITLSALNGYATESFVTSQGYITSADIPDIPVIPTNISAFYNDKGYITLTNLNGYATETFVTSQGYITLADIPDFPVIPTDISAFNNDVGYITNDALNGYATENFVTSQGYAKASDIPVVPTKISAFTNDVGYITSSALSGYATETFVTSQGYITVSALSGYATESFVTSQGYITVDALNGYATTTNVSTAVSTHNTATDAHTALFNGKENVGVAQRLIADHAVVTASDSVLGHIKVDNDTITVDENGVATSHAIGHNIFDIFYSMSSTTPPGAMDLSLGTLIASCNTVFPDFWEACVARKADGSIRTLTEDEWQAEVTENGSCGAFVVDETAMSVRLPKITHMIQPGDIGEFTEAGLPNITAMFVPIPIKNSSSGNVSSPIISYSGALTMSHETDRSLTGFQISPITLSSSLYRYNFAASSSNAIYGKSTTVQPPAVGAKLYIQVYISAIPASVAQAAEFINMLESYLPLSGGTMTGGITSTVEDIVARGDTTGRLAIHGGIAYQYGASIYLIGKDHATAPGIFALYANDGAEYNSLIGYPDGNLTWGDVPVLNPTGTVIAFAGNSAPDGYLICNGAAVSRATYASLFAVIGTTYGAGDGSSTFNLPNLTDKFIMGSGTAGTSKSAGLPNISGGFTTRVPNSHVSYALGAFFGSDSTETSVTTTAAAYLGSGSSTWTNSARYGYGFRASRSNSIYGNSSTVQPPALTMRFYIKY